jgi:hypothetical protein
MGFAWESANVRNFGTPEIWEYPPRSPRHRKPRPQRMHVVAALAHAAFSAAGTVPHRAKVAVVTRPSLADHRRAF